MSHEKPDECWCEPASGVDTSVATRSRKFGQVWVGGSSTHITAGFTHARRWNANLLQSSWLAFRWTLYQQELQPNKTPHGHANRFDHQPADEDAVAAPVVSSTRPPSNLCALVAVKVVLALRVCREQQHHHIAPKMTSAARASDTIENLQQHFAPAPTPTAAPPHLTYTLYTYI